jgi:hypothetical protein
VSYSRLLPQIKKVGTTEILEAFATHLHNHAEDLAKTAEEKAMVSSVLGELLAGQLAKLDFFKDDPSRRPGAPGYNYSYLTNTPRSSPDTAVAFMGKCVATGNPQLVEASVKRMIDMKGVPPAEAQSRAKAVLLPLVPRICADPVLRGALSDDLVRQLGQEAVRLSLEGIVALKGRITREELAALLDVSVQSGNIDTIGAAYVDSPFLDENSTYIALLKGDSEVEGAPMDRGRMEGNHRGASFAPEDTSSCFGRPLQDDGAGDDEDIRS